MNVAAKSKPIQGRLWERDADIAAVVYDHGVLNTSEIWTLFFNIDNKGSSARRRLAQLTDMGVLVNYVPPRLVRSKKGTGKNAPSNGAGKVVRGRSEYEYMLGPVGARMVAEERGVSLNALNWKRDQFVNPKVRGHRLAVNAFFTTYARACKMSGGAYEFRDWIGERGCRERYGGLGNSYGDTADVIPDGAAMLVRYPSALTVSGSCSGSGDDKVIASPLYQHPLDTVDLSTGGIGSNTRSDERLAPIGLTDLNPKELPDPTYHPIVLELDRGFEHYRVLHSKAQRYRWLGDESESAVLFVFTGEGDARAETQAKTFIYGDKRRKIPDVGAGRIAAAVFEDVVADPFGNVWWVLDRAADERVTVWEV